jgi:hypothetical protein
LSDRVWDNRTSLIIDPPDGRIPAPAPGAAERARAQAAAQQRRGPADSAADLTLGTRCISYGTPNIRAGYQSYFEITQGPGVVALRSEMIHDVRIFSTENTSPHIASTIRQYHGDSRARWEGDTLVVETTNFRRNIDETSYNCCGYAGEGLTIVERFTLVDKDTIDYRYTVNDPTIFTRPWTVSLPMRRAPGPIYEYACHEGNHAMVGILRGGRAMEKKKDTTTQQGARN